MKISKAEPVSTDEEEEEDDISEPETEKGNARSSMSFLDIGLPSRFTHGVPV